MSLTLILNHVGNVVTVLRKASGNVANLVPGVLVASRVVGSTSDTHCRFALRDILSVILPSWTVSSAIPISIALWVNFRHTSGRSPCSVGRNLGVVDRTEPMMQSHVEREVTSLDQSRIRKRANEIKVQSINLFLHMALTTWVTAILRIVKLALLARFKLTSIWLV
jgi:hypothetical protein